MSEIELVHKEEPVVNHHNVELTTKLDVETDKIEVEHKHSIDLTTLIVVSIIIGSLFTSYDSEIRCSLGNKKECAKMEVIQPVQSNSR